MEERKKLGALGVIGLLLLLLLLAAACFLSVGLSDLSMGMGPWGIYTTDGKSLTLVDYASAGADWDNETKIAAWIRTK